jgi:uncharacterized protein
VRFIIPFLLLFLFEYIVFQPVAMVIADCPMAVQWVVRSLYWMAPLALWMVMVNRMKHRHSPLTVGKFAYYFQNSLVGLYFGKIVVALLLATDAFRRLLFSLFSCMSGDQYSSFPLMKEVSFFALAVGLSLTVILIYGMMRNRYRYKIHRKTIILHKLPIELHGLKIIQISDIHSGSFTETNPLQKAIALINREAADLVFFTGDLVNNVASEMEPFVPVFKEIKARHGVFSILGNHDYGDYVLWKSTEAKLQNFRSLLQTHRQLGWELLLNENRLLNIGGASLAIIGVENYSTKGRFSRYGDLAKAAEGTSGVDVKLLLSHDPSHWMSEVVADYKDIAVTFSGHTHGMQFGIEVTDWFKWSPVQYIYKEWAGLYQRDKQYLYVNRGFGFLGYPGRVGVLAEITVLTLEQDPSGKA